MLLACLFCFQHNFIFELFPNIYFHFNAYYNYVFWLCYCSYYFFRYTQFCLRCHLTCAEGWWTNDIFLHFKPLLCKFCSTMLTCSILQCNNLSERYFMMLILRGKKYFDCALKVWGPLTIRVKTILRMTYRGKALRSVLSLLLAWELGKELITTIVRSVCLQTSYI